VALPAMARHVKWLLSILNKALQEHLPSKLRCITSQNFLEGLEKIANNFILLLVFVKEEYRNH